ncbi:glycoside hydrolase family 88/105 protein [Zunongwangia atlantica]|uniref:Rhamnogalacturonides degradation protein RhiN n=1 Tax=Zunongwangia atlantica 22II14-10F7 TaxID=1185767 RepID=A0A1Y1T8I1_9FLAO|nr:glycoside hydrolase family 88 protein [Zunongwangia atlantica]ORL47359.1 Rhamnogalacturonides degradation protein RhiN [Zunongwangia atlantica 22II14-10F7]
MKTIEFQKYRSFLFIIILAVMAVGCKNKEEKKTGAVSTESEMKISDSLKWSERMLLSEIARFPDPTLLDFREKPKWNYTNGLILTATQRVYEETNKQAYYDYIYEFGDKMVNENGEIKTYTQQDYKLDVLKPGDALLYLYSQTKEERFLKALQTLRMQITGQPRTSDGGFWHKKVYEHQMWLDGLYMAQPFYAHYTKMFSEGEEAEKAYNEIVKQFALIQKHTLDEKTGLLYHGWDEKKQQDWADPNTGTSANFWSRAMGWYGMALVDVLDYLPEDHSGRKDLISYLNQFVDAVAKVQDKDTGLWYQVLDKGDLEGNYLEATGSSMFVYVMAKGVNQGYLPTKYRTIAEKGFQGLLDHLVEVEPSGMVNLKKCCAVAGLGGDRDGSFEYYINEEVRANDPKGTGPFIMASLELNK